ncbi:MAG: hypothetical protein JOY78_05435 [Pseudonocardia sp.]|nr:hypothetical protein [Pseudonocardia sp.]
MSDQIRRLRPAHTPDELTKLYATPHEHRGWDDHRVRVATTAQWAHQLVGWVGTAADLSCGDGAILKALDVDRQRYFGDFAPGWDFTGPIEQTITSLPNVDLFVCCETLEHLDDPSLVLKQIRARTDHLLLSTPIDAWQDTNPEHYWAWSRDGVEDLLTEVGFEVRAFMSLDFRPMPRDYCYGVWVAR